MKKKVLFILSLVFILSLIIMVILILFPKKQKKTDDLIPVYHADVVCTFDGVDTFENETHEYSLRAYLTVKDHLVTKAILVSVSTDDNIYETRRYIEEYNKINGINAQVSFKEGSLVTEVEYDYETIDLDEVKNKLGYLLIDDSIFKRVSSLPVSLEYYQEYELQDYICN